MLNDIHLMDCKIGMRQLSDNSAQIIIADPPYNIGKDFGNNSDKMSMPEYLLDCDIWIAECLRILKNNGTMFIYGFSEILAHIFVRINCNKRWLVWHYTNKNSANAGFWQRSHESIICMWKDDRIFNEDMVREPYTEGFVNGANGRIRPATKGRFSNSDKVTTYKVHENGALPRDVIKIPALSGALGSSERWFVCKTCNIVSNNIDLHKEHDIEKHPTQKPLAICDKLILSCMQKDGFVLVPFAGSGSECVAAKKNGLNFIGYELTKEYIDIAEARLKNPEKEFSKEEKDFQELPEETKETIFD